MSDAPETIWAMGHRGFEAYTGTWIDERDGPETVQYTRTDISQAAISVAHAAGVREGMERAAVIADAKCYAGPGEFMTVSDLTADDIAEAIRAAIPSK